MNTTPSHLLVQSLSLSLDNCSLIPQSIITAPLLCDAGCNQQRWVYYHHNPSSNTNVQSGHLRYHRGTNSCPDGKRFLLSSTNHVCQLAPSRLEDPNTHSTFQFKKPCQWPHWRLQGGTGRVVVQWTRGLSFVRRTSSGGGTAVMSMIKRRGQDGDFTLPALDHKRKKTRIPFHIHCLPTPDHGTWEVSRKEEGHSQHHPSRRGWGACSPMRPEVLLLPALSRS